MQPNILSVLSHSLHFLASVKPWTELVSYIYVLYTERKVLNSVQSYLQSDRASNNYQGSMAVITILISLIHTHTHKNASIMIICTWQGEIETDRSHNLPPFTANRIRIRVLICLPGSRSLCPSLIAALTKETTTKAYFCFKNRAFDTKPNYKKKNQERTFSEES